MSKRSQALVGPNAQERLWAGPQGDNYVRRFFWSPEQVDKHWLAHYSQIPRSQIFDEHFVKFVTVNEPVLEIGCNCGNQLEYLWQKGYRQLNGIDINALAIKTMLEKRSYLRGWVASAASVPHPDQSFEVVMTCWCLCHLPPDKYKKALAEIKRIARRWVFLSEPYAEKETCYHKDYIWTRPVAADLGGSVASQRFVTAGKGKVVTQVTLLSLK